MELSMLSHWHSYYAANFGHAVPKEAKSAWDAELSSADIAPAMKAIDMFIRERESARESLTLGAWRVLYRRAQRRAESREADTVAAASCGHCLPPGWKRLVYGGQDGYRTPHLCGQDSTPGEHPVYAVRGTFCTCPAGQAAYDTWRAERDAAGDEGLETPAEIERLRAQGMTPHAAFVLRARLAGGAHPAAVLDPRPAPARRPRRPPPPTNRRQPADCWWHDKDESAAAIVPATQDVTP